MNRNQKLPNIDDDYDQHPLNTSTGEPSPPHNQHQHYRQKIVNPDVASHLAAVLRTEKEKEARMLRDLTTRLLTEEGAERARSTWAERAGLVRRRREEKKNKIEQKKYEFASKRVDAERRAMEDIVNSQQQQNNQHEDGNNNNKHGASMFSSSTTKNSQGQQRIERVKQDLVREYMMQNSAAENVRRRLEVSVQSQMAKDSLESRSRAVKNRLVDAIRYGNNNNDNEQQHQTTPIKNYREKVIRPEIKLSPNRRLLLSPEAIEILRNSYERNNASTPEPHNNSPAGNLMNHYYNTLNINNNNDNNKKSKSKEKKSHTSMGFYRDHSIMNQNNNIQTQPEFRISPQVDRSQLFRDKEYNFKHRNFLHDPLAPVPADDKHARDMKRAFKMVASENPSAQQHQQDHSPISLRLPGLADLAGSGRGGGGPPTFSSTPLPMARAAMAARQAILIGNSANNDENDEKHDRKNKNKNNNNTKKKNIDKATKKKTRPLLLHELGQHDHYFSSSPSPVNPNRNQQNFMMFGNGVIHGIKDPDNDANFNDNELGIYDDDEDTASSTDEKCLETTGEGKRKRSKKSNNKNIKSTTSPSPAPPKSVMNFNGDGNNNNQNKEENGGKSGSGHAVADVSFTDNFNATTNSVLTTITTNQNTNNNNNNVIIHRQPSLLPPRHHHSNSNTPTRNPFQNSENNSNNNNKNVENPQFQQQQQQQQSTTHHMNSANDYQDDFEQVDEQNDIALMRLKQEKQKLSIELRQTKNQLHATNHELGILKPSYYANVPSMINNNNNNGANQANKKNIKKSSNKRNY